MADAASRARTTATSTTSASSGRTAGRSTSTRSASGWPTASWPSWSGECESDSLNRLVVTAGLDVAAGRRSCAPTASTAHRVNAASPEYKNDAFASQPPIAGEADRRSSRRRFDPARRRAIPPRSTRIRAEILRDLDAVASLDARPDPARRARRDRRRPSGRTPSVPGGHDAVVQVPLGGRAGHAEAVPAVRDLRALAARWRRSTCAAGESPAAASAGRTAARLPHRGPRPDEDADGEERRHRARPASRAASASSSRSGDPRRARRGVDAAVPEFMRGLLDVTDNLVERHGRAPAGVVRPRRRRPVPRRRGRQGHRAFSDTANAHRDELRVLARRRLRVRRLERATTTRRWASPRAAPGSRCKRHFREMGMDADATASPSSASATCRATCSATGCCSRARCGWSPRSTTGTSSSTRTPTRRRSSPSASACSTCRGRRWDDYDRVADLDGRRRLRPRGAKAIPLSPEVRGARSASTARARSTPDEVDPAILRAPVDLLWNGGIGTYVKASAEIARRRRRPRERRRARQRDRAARAGWSARAGTSASRSAARIEYALSGGRINTDVDRQLGGRRHLRPRGEPEDPARARRWPAAT